LAGATANASPAPLVAGLGERTSLPENFEFASLKAAGRLQKMSNFNVLARRFAARLLRRGAPTRRASAIFCARDFAIAPQSLVNNI